MPSSLGLDSIVAAVTDDGSQTPIGRYWSGSISYHMAFQRVDARVTAVARLVQQAQVTPLEYRRRPREVIRDHQARDHDARECPAPAYRSPTGL